VSLRTAEQAVRVDRVVILGGGEEAEALARACQETLGLVPTRAPRLKGQGISWKSRPEDELRRHAVPALGALVAASRGVSAIDFANPTTPPDTSAGVRQGVMAAVLGLVVVCGGGWVLSQRALGELERRADLLKGQAEDLEEEYYRSLLRGAPLAHFEAWRGAAPDLGAHLAHLRGQIPDPPEAYLGGIALTVRTGVSLAEDALPLDTGAYVPARQTTFTLSGAATGDVTQAFRQSLLDSGEYFVETRGSEVDGRFELTLMTGAEAPPAAETADSASGERAVASVGPTADRAAGEGRGR